MRTACINTTYFRNKQGYGQISVEGKTRAHHRVAYCIANKLTLKDIEGLVVMHKCDNPSCVNPEHLELGTHKDNTADMYAKQRNASPPPPVRIGAANGNSRLTEEKVREIKKMIASCAPYKEIAVKFSISPSTVCQIATGKTWKQVTI